MTRRQTPAMAAMARAGISLVLMSSCVPEAEARSPDETSASAANAAIADLRREMETLRAENRALARRLATLEAGKQKSLFHAVPGQQPSTTVSGGAGVGVATPGAFGAPGGVAQAGTAGPIEQQASGPGQQAAATESRAQQRLEQRVRELELSKTAQEDAVRSIIRDSFAKIGPNINQALSLSGVLDVTASRSRDFSNQTTSSVNLSSAELQFEIQPTPWATGNLVVQFNDGTNVLFPTTRGFSQGVDRFTVDTAYFNLGNTQRFPPFLRAGRMVLPFGISTGNILGDVLSAENPLTVEAFEMRKTALGFGLEFPTPQPGPPAPPVVVPPVKPAALYPLVTSLSQGLGYRPLPTRPTRLTATTPKPVPPPYHASIYFYEGNTFGGGPRGTNPTNHIDATAGFRLAGHCGRSYESLRHSLTCPWSLAVDVDYNSSVFNSRFLETEYQGFLDQIGFVRGMAASVKSNFGPFSLIAEWNGAINRAKFTDDLGKQVAIKPAAWQVSLGYQFGWNPWVEEIGAQGTYISVGYSRSRDLAGVTELINNAPTRVGFLPRKRFILTVGEWATENVRVELEYSRNWDYSTIEGGTGSIGHGVLAKLTYAF